MKKDAILIVFAAMCASAALVTAANAVSSSATNKASIASSQSAPFVVNLYYTGTNGSARAFVKEMTEGGTVAAIRAERGNLRYEYFFSADDPETALLIDAWADQASLDAHHASPMMVTIAALREKHDLKMRAERFVPAVGGLPEKDRAFIRK